MTTIQIPGVGCLTIEGKVSIFELTGTVLIENGSDADKYFNFCFKLKPEQKIKVNEFKVEQKKIEHSFATQDDAVRMTLKDSLSEWDKKWLKR